MPESIRNNTTIWIAGIIAAVIVFAIIACTVIFVITMLYGDVEDSAGLLLFTA